MKWWRWQPPDRRLSLCWQTMRRLRQARRPLTPATRSVRGRTRATICLALRDDSAQALVTNDATSKLALAFDANQGKTMAFFDNASAKPEVGGLALFSAQNLNNPRSIITANAKPVPGVLPSNINGTQFAELERKRANVVTRVGGLSSLVGGGTSRAGYWADAVYWLLWMKNESTLAVWNAMRGSRRLTPAIIRDVMTAVLELGVRNGGIQPAGSLVDSRIPRTISSSPRGIRNSTAR